jgi:hydroxymethylpyrimidine pyrophosphatase-like HAD family hydrolase
MRYVALACDYDGTLAEHGHVAPRTVRALEELRATGRRLILVTGRLLEDLSAVFPQITLFDVVVAENGGVLYDVPGGNVESLAEQPSQDFVRKLRDRRVSPLSVGRVIVATCEPHEHTVLKAIHDLKLERQLIFNKGAVMVLPSGVDKASGLHHALQHLKLAAQNTVAVGDAENDLAMLSFCGCGVAVANALESVKARADWVTDRDHGDGVVELIRALIESDLARLNPR